MKKCKTCGVEKPLTEFRKHKKRISAVCKACIKLSFSTSSCRARLMKRKRDRPKKLSTEQVNYLSDFFEGK